jgi:hypothetical protein
LTGLRLVVRLTALATKKPVRNCINAILRGSKVKGGFAGDARSRHRGTAKSIHLAGAPRTRACLPAQLI